MTTKAFDLIVVGNLLSVVVKDGGRSIESSLPREVCPVLVEPDCNCYCDGSHGADDNNDESEEDVLGRLQYNAILDALESMVLAHACAGIKVDDPRYITGLETILEACGNSLMLHQSAVPSFASVSAASAFTTFTRSKMTPIALKRPVTRRSRASSRPAAGCRRWAWSPRLRLN